MIGVAPPPDAATVHIVGGGIDRDYIKAFTQAHEKSDFDATIGIHPTAAEEFVTMK